MENTVENVAVLENLADNIPLGISRAPDAHLLLLVAFVVLYAKVISKLGKPAIQEFVSI